MPEIGMICHMRETASGRRWKAPTPDNRLAVVVFAAALASCLWAAESVAGWRPHPLLLFVSASISLAAAWYGLGRAHHQHREQARRVQAAYDSAQMPHGVTQDIIDLVRSGKKIHAIKRYRELNHGVELREAKDIIDAI
jgi:hypothetical protein